MFEHGFTYVYFHPHPPRNRLDLIFIDRNTKVHAKDLFNLFDGMAIDPNGDVVFFQVKTNSWDGFKEITEFTQGKKVKAMLLNAVDRKGVSVRFINYQPVEAPIAEEEDIEQIEMSVDLNI